MKNLFIMLFLVGAITNVSFSQPAAVPQEEEVDVTVLKEQIFESLKNAAGSKAIFMGEHSAALGYLYKNNDLSNLSYNKMVAGYKSAAQDEKVFEDVMARIMGQVYFSRAAAENEFRIAEEKEAKEKNLPWEPAMPSLAERQSNITDQAIIRLSALTTAQNQQIIQQNERIITLLEQLTKKKE